MVTDRESLLDAIQEIADTFTGLDRIECALILNKIEPLIRADERGAIATAIEANCHHMKPICWRCERAAQIARNWSAYT